ncbi:MAG: hypothetical protein K8I82_17055 [Anaerolineae bacterium]|nr:hypothetical protein [Anaerolineae bacterium]
MYLAVPLPAFHGVFKEPTIGQLAIQEFGIRLIVFDAVQTEIVAWVT